ncbi:TonB-dependent receptor domain-containing protein [uncultured Croceitalea sp.]|uniref:TonB-dependent receptor domain-containing protein n=1 Tax=uncultured Croceitalea sp. TaxID=1798908 RepID=UPI00374F6FC3
MKLKVFSSLLLFCFTITISGQLTVSGKVTGKEGTPVQDAEVYLKEIQLLTTTNSEGNFEFKSISGGKYTIIVFAYEYEVFERELTFDKPFTVDIALEAIEAKQLSEVVLTQRREQVFALQKLKKVEGTAIYAGKKSEVVLVENIIGNTAANNPRQIYSQVVGLNIYENGDAGLQLNIGGRGLDPNRSANFTVRQNGYDISADALGYPESYYTPPAEALQEIQVVRGAASLQYGPQFGGLINFKFKKPNPNKEIEWISRQTLGSFDLKTSFNSLSGTVGNFSYYTYFNYKEGNGFRPNSNFNSRNYFGQFNYQLSKKTKLTFDATLFNYLAKQAGGLTDAQFIENPDFSNRNRNWFDIDWKLFTLRLEHRFSENTDFSVYVSTLDASRKAVGFRTNRVSQPDVPSEPRELLSDEFRNIAAEARLLNRYKIGDKDAVFLIGSKYYQSFNNQRQGPGTAANGPEFSFAQEEFPNYERQSAFEFPNLNLAVFGENIFNISDKFSLTPGYRFEYINTESEGSFRRILLDLAGNPLVNEEIPENADFERGFFLFGLGASYKLKPTLEAYANISQNYRSVTFNDIRVVNPTLVVDPNITDEDGFTADIGLRGRSNNFFTYDVSVFGLLYKDRLGEILAIDDSDNSVFRRRGNIGDAFIYGLETFADVNLKEVAFPSLDKLKLNYFLNLALTNSEYTDSEENNVRGNQVEFIPEINLKTGLNFGYGNLLGSIQYTYLSEQFTDATNAPQDVNDNQRGIEGTIPAYDILDFSLSYTYKRFKIEAGINNLLDNSYFTRRATGYPGPGIIPSEPRTFYTTFQFKL